MLHSRSTHIPATRHAKNNANPVSLYCRTGNLRPIEMVRPMLGMALMMGLVACSIHPDPLKQQEIATTLRQDQLKLFADQEPVHRPIDLYEAMARALKYNLDLRMQMLEKAVVSSDIDLANNDVLPMLAANAGFTSRNNAEASSGFSITTASPSNNFSTSQDRQKTTANLSVAWSVLDFGVSYYQAKQTTDRFLIAEENRRKLTHTLIQEVQTAYWQALGAQRLHSQIDPILQQAKQAIEDAHELEVQRLRPQLEMVRYQRALLDIIRQLESLQEELQQAKITLVKLINLPPGLPFELLEPDEKTFCITPIRVTPSEMEQLALLNRPELRQELYRARISIADTKKAMLQILPGLDFNAAHNYDSNSFAMNSVWESAGINVTGKLLRLAALPGELRKEESQVELSQMRRLALNMAIITQVHIANRQYRDAVRKFDEAGKINTIDQKILKNITLETASGSQTRLEHIRAATQGVMSQLQRSKAFADAQTAVGMIFVSLGVDLLPNIAPGDTIDTMAKAIREALEAWNEGISLPPPGAEGSDSAMAANTLKGETPEENQVAIPSSTVHEITLDDSGHKPEPINAPSPITPAPVPETKKVRPPSASVPAKAPTVEKAIEQEQVPPPVVTNPVVKRERTITHDTIVTEAQPVQDVSTPGTSTPIIDPEPEIRQLIEAWADAWSRHGIQEFFRFYSDSFVPANQFTLQQWKDAYTLLFDTSKSVKVALLDQVVEVESAHRAKVSVILNFADSDSQNEKHKTLILSKERKGWRIVEEISDVTLSSEQSRTITNIKPMAVSHNDPLDDRKAPSPVAETFLPIATPAVIEGIILHGPKRPMPKDWQTQTPLFNADPNPPELWMWRNNSYTILKL
ncbi:MAG: TolC family protein [Magnetococcales bacterium]|nr:TolC family protein [Magnetococcales bacterium]